MCRFAPFKFPSAVVVLAALLGLVALNCAHAQQPGERDRGDTASGREAQQEGLTEQILYQYLISEIAGQRGRTGLAVQGMTGLARATRDPRLARRALEIAFQARQFTTAMEAASLWLELEPDSSLARQAISVLITNRGDLDSATQNLKQLLGDKEKAPALYMQVNSVLNRFPDKQIVLKAVQDLAAVQPQLPESQFAIAQAAAQAKNFDLALASAKRASALDPKFQPSIILQGQLLRESSEQDAALFFEDYLARNPDAKDVRVSYARLLVAQKSYLNARAEYRRAEQIAPDDAEIPYAVGLLSQQIGDYAGAEAAYRRTLSLKLRDRNPVLLNLGQVEEAREDWDAAIAWYKQITDSEYFVAAQLKVAGVLAKQQGIASGRKYLQEVETESSEQRVQLILAEAQLLRDAKAFREAYTLLTDSLDRFPDSVELFYDRAMVAEKIDRLDDLEHDLRHVIELKPDHAHAYNALGYTLADRTTRFTEAYELIQKAVSLAPEDAFIIDSLGWVQFRLGKMVDALQTLKKAYLMRRDPEIAAHLGEVMWASGSRDEAAKLWRAALLEHPGNDSLISVLQKYKP
jgi:tetratricopeptide (TPR) repeat protein